MTLEDVDVLIARYEDAAARHGRARTPRAANRAADEIATIHRELRKRGGLQALLPLLKSGDDSVHSWAAAHALELATPDAILVLEELADTQGFIGLDARMTLQLWRAGRLEFP